MAFLKDGKYQIKVGQLFGLLTVVEQLGFYRPWNTAAYRVACECGTTKLVCAGNLVSGRQQSCGCIKRTHGKTKSSEYSVRRSMKERCHNPNASGFKDYGGRGVMVCDQ